MRPWFEKTGWWALASAVTAGCGQVGEVRSAATGAEGGCPLVAGETVTWVVTSTPGGSLDVLSRLLEPFFETAVGAQIVVENRSGAGGAIGARAIRDADPDGKTLGILNGSARLVEDLADEIDGLHPLDDFTVLGRVSVEDRVWLVGPSSRYRTIEDVLRNVSGDSLVFSLTDVGGAAFLSASVPAELLGVKASYVTGYPGGNELSIALIRGEVDLAALSFETVRSRIESGELTPILQLAAEPIEDHPSLRGVPLFSGPDGLAARVARERGGDPEAAIRMAAAIGQIAAVGRIVVGPPGLPAELAACLSARLSEVVNDPTVLAAASQARRTIRFADPQTVLAQTRAAEEDLRLLQPILHQHIDRARGVAPGR